MSSLPVDAATEFPPYDDEEPFELRDMRIADASCAKAVLAERAEIVNVGLERCDVVGFAVHDGRASRVLVEHSRLRGVTWVNGLLQDVTLDDVTGSDLSFRFSTLRRVVLRDCGLPGLDLSETVFDDVRLERCDLSGAQLHHARVKSLRIEGCTLTGLTGAGALAGASIHPDDLLALAPSLADAIGLTVQE